jgi:hypothetical protein
VKNNAIARRMVGKWFNRDPEKGYFDMDLIHSRGFDDATYYDVHEAEKLTRGMATLADAGQELLENTFLIVNDIKYFDKRNAAKAGGILIKVAGAVASEYTGESIYKDLGNIAGDIVSKIEGFKVTVITHLYQLAWNEKYLSMLYEDYYVDSTNFCPEKKAGFDNEMQFFRMKYIGMQSVFSGKTSIAGVNTETPEQMIRKVCTRAIDKSIVQLQRAHEVFRVKTPIFEVKGNIIKAKVGLNEGVTKKTKFEVLEHTMDKNEKIQYKRVGVIKPAGRIWDNRYMAVEERAKDAFLNYTEFKKISGGNLQPGMLIRQIK